jgi:dienelactone hydrolase
VPMTGLRVQPTWADERTYATILVCGRSRSCRSGLHPISCLLVSTDAKLTARSGSGVSEGRDIEKRESFVRLHWRRRTAFAFVMAATSGMASAQELREFLTESTRDVKQLDFSTEVKELGVFSNLSNTLFKPKGAPPYRTVVLGHTCGGVTRPHIRERMNELLDAGFAVVALDSFGPRGLQQCRNQNVIRTPGTVMDAYRMLSKLQSVPQVDQGRIYFAGFSWGGVVAPMLASPQSAQAFGSTARYRAIASWYGGCSYEQATPAAKIRYLFEDSDRPLLMLMAGQDKEFKASNCFPLMDEMKAAGKPVSWHIYSEVHHAWDQSEHRGNYTITTPTGERNVYKYDAEATKDSTRRMIEFFNENR